MALNVKIIQHEEFLEVVVTGTYNMQDAAEGFPHVLSTCRQAGLSKILIDFRNLTGTLAATEKVIYTFGIQDHYKNYISTGGQELMIAYVGNAQQVSTYEPEQKIARDNNMPFDLFSDIEEAYEWLGIKPT